MLFTTYALLYSKRCWHPCTSLNPKPIYIQPTWLCRSWNGTLQCFLLGVQGCLTIPHVLVNSLSSIHSKIHPLATSVFNAHLGGGSSSRLSLIALFSEHVVVPDSWRHDRHSSKERHAAWRVTSDLNAFASAVLFAGLNSEWKLAVAFALRVYRDAKLSQLVRVSLPRSGKMTVVKLSRNIVGRWDDLSTQVRGRDLGRLRDSIKLSLCTRFTSPSSIRSFWWRWWKVNTSVDQMSSSKPVFRGSSGQKDTGPYSSLLTKMSSAMQMYHLKSGRFLCAWDSIGRNLYLLRCYFGVLPVFAFLRLFPGSRACLRYVLIWLGDWNFR